MKFRLKVRKHLVNFTLLKGRRLCGQIVKEQESVPIRYAVVSYIHYRGPPVPDNLPGSLRSTQPFTAR